MGYEVHITREEEFWDDGGISLEEWLSCVAQDDSMRHDGYAEAETPGGTLRYENEGLCVWLGYTGHGKNGGMASFDHSNGHISVKNPDSETLGKMFELATALGADVVGDEGEKYDSSANMIRPSDSLPSASPNKPWWKFW